MNERISDPIWVCTENGNGMERCTSWTLRLGRLESQQSGGAITRRVFMGTQCPKDRLKFNSIIFQTQVSHYSERGSCADRRELWHFLFQLICFSFASLFIFLWSTSRHFLIIVISSESLIFADSDCPHSAHACSLRISGVAFH